MKLSKKVFWPMLLINVVLFLVCAFLKFPCMVAYLFAAASIIDVYNEKLFASGMRCFFRSIGKKEKYTTFCVWHCIVFFILGTIGLILEISSL